MYAFALTSVVVVTSIKRTSSLWGILWGWLFFQETSIRERLFGTLVTLAGMVLVIL
jgi:drug/metabolite transporter (DMT)-like permease